MSTPNPHTADAPDLWSAVADGEASGPELQSALSSWRQGSSSESTWHIYHLIGDTLRSAELALPRQRDDRLLQAVRERLAGEPVVIAPSAPSTPDAALASRRGWRLWSGSAAMAAGVGAVGVMVWLTQAPLPADSSVAARSPGPASFAAGPSPSSARTVSLGGSASVGPAAASAAGGMLRDARLDEYLAAHRQLGAGRPLGTPAGYAQASAGAGAR